jgi:uncharacterized protein YcbX
MSHATDAMPRIAALTVYPLKSAAGIAVTSLPLDARGAVGDRRWLLVDGEGQAITARTCHALLRIVPRFAGVDRDGALLLDAPGLPTFTAVPPGADAGERLVEVWGDPVPAEDAGDEAADWCSAATGIACRLVRVAETARRPLKAKYAGPLDHAGRHVAFTDGAPLLLLGLPSVAALNDRLLEQGGHDVMDRRRFRANVWLDGLAPHEEDRWRQVSIGNVTLGVGSLCVRCVLTTVDPDTQEQGTEPLRTFAQYRRTEDGVVFGVNATHVAPGTLRVGDAVEVLARR